MLERMDRVDEAIRVLGADIAVKRYGTQNTPTAYAELLSRHGQLDDLRKLASGEHAHTVLDVFADALRDRGRTAEAETVMRDAIAADDWVGYRAWLSSSLLQDGRLDDAITVAEPGFSWYDCSNLLAPLVYLLSTVPRSRFTFWTIPSPCPTTTTRSSSTRGGPSPRQSRSHRGSDRRGRSPPRSVDRPPPRPSRASSLPLATSNAAARNCGPRARPKHVRICSRSWSSAGRAAEAVIAHPTVAEQRAAGRRPHPSPCGRTGTPRNPLSRRCLQMILPGGSWWRDTSPRVVGRRMGVRPTVVASAVAGSEAAGRPQSTERGSCGSSAPGPPGATCPSDTVHGPHSIPVSAGGCGPELRLEVDPHLAIAVRWERRFEGLLATSGLRSSEAEILSTAAVCCPG